MLRSIIHNRMPISFALSCVTGYVLLHRWPFPADHAMLQLILLHKPWLFESIRWSYTTMLFSTPLIAFSSLFALLYIFAAKGDAALVRNPLPAYEPSAARGRLYLIVGEIHQQKRLGPVENPQWLTIPERGLFTGIAVFGAIGSGKTSCCMVPFAEQILFYCAADAERRISALVLEVKGDFCLHVRDILESHGRAGDYVEVGLDSPYRYNPLHDDLDAHALAYGRDDTGAAAGYAQAPSRSNHSGRGARWRSI